MSNNSGFAATMYECNPAVAALNTVPGFDPLKLMGRRRMPGVEREERYLDFRYKKLWFRLAHKKGRIRLNKLSVTEQFAMIEAQVFLELTDAVPVSSFTAVCSREEDGDRYVESAQIRAMDQALTDAGFGLQFVPAPVESVGDAVSQKPTAQTTIQQSASQQVTARQEPATQTVQQSPVMQQSVVQQRPAVQQPTDQQRPVAAQPVARQQPVTQQAAVQQRPVQQTPQQQRPATVQQPATQQSAAPARPARTAQGAPVQKGTVRPAQTAAGVQRAVVDLAASVSPQKAAPAAAAPQPTAGLPAGAEPLSADQLPVAAEEQTLPVTSDMAAAMSMLSGKGASDTLPVTPESVKAEEKAAVSAETVSTAADVSAADAGACQEAGEEKPYTETTPVDQILQFMTLEDAKKVVVPTGTCKGWTLDEVAQRRRPSLRFYLSEGYQGKDNILRAAASLVLDDLEKKAG